MDNYVILQRNEMSKKIIFFRSTCACRSFVSGKVTLVLKIYKQMKIIHCNGCTIVGHFLLCACGRNVMVEVITAYNLWATKPNVFDSTCALLRS